MSNRTEDEAKELAKAITHQLVDLPREHGAVFGARDATKVGLPVIESDPKGLRWRMIWRLWTKYFAHGTAIYEGRMASQIINYTSS
jgi:hypothetical protein